MTHLELENLASEFLEGLLEPSQQAAVEAHLSECAGCRELMGDVRHALEVCRVAEAVEPKPWLIAKIMLATIGEHKPTWGEQIAAYVRLVLQPRVAYPIAMTVFTFSLIVNVVGLNLRSLRVEDLNPRTWVLRADRQGHLLAARAEKFYYDLRVVYEIESRFRQLSGQPQGQEEPSPKPAAPGGGSSQGIPSEQTVASNGAAGIEVAAKSASSLATAGNQTGLVRSGRTLIP
ncbi:MAG TPA: zf-HC2 domain-containing protein [Terriglobia bacterium]|nr:zf-HC2 domain-containing protein [Terriglobia bacterium]